MLLSVLIPTYNYDCTRLVEVMLKLLPSDFEIVVGDDGSNDENVKSALAKIELLNNVRVVRTDTCHGSSANRNRLTHEAQGKYLLFLDADGLPADGEFLNRYLNLIPFDGAICGSLSVVSDDKTLLRYKYEKSYEDYMKASKRNLNPYKNFRTFNYMVRRDVAISCPFDETIQMSGYEDVLLGRQLKEKNIKVLHIDNDFLNVGIEQNDVYLEKIHRQLHTLWRMRNEFEGYSSLLDLYNKVKKLRLLWIFRLFHKLFYRIELNNLMSRCPSILVFQLYKFGFFCNIR